MNAIFDFWLRDKEIKEMQDVSTRIQLIRAIKKRILPKSSIEKMLLRRHKPRCNEKSIELVIRNNGVMQKDDWQKKHVG